MTQGTIDQWGGDLAVRLPRDVVEAVALHDGDSVEIDTRDDSIIIRQTHPRLVLAELFRGKTAEEWRVAYAGAYDWDMDLGREIVLD